MVLWSYSMILLSTIQFHDSCRCSQCFLISSSLWSVLFWINSYLSYYCFFVTDILILAITIPTLKLPARHWLLTTMTVSVCDSPKALLNGHHDHQYLNDFSNFSSFVTSSKFHFVVHVVNICCSNSSKNSFAIIW